MLPADRALTSRLLAISRTARWPAIGTRHRSTEAKVNKWSIRKSKTTSRVVSDGGSLGEDGSLKKLDPAARVSFLRSETFIPWLISRLRTTEKATSDDNYATFLRNLVAVFPNKSVQIALESQNTTQSANWHPSEQTRPIALLRSLRSAFRSHGAPGVDLQLKYAYHGLLASRKLSKVDLQDQERLADLRYPIEWYPATRAVQRKIILHVGPTNSGKTYQALKRLEQAETGIYAGPLRLLAHEVYSRLNAKGRVCDLLTGDERSSHQGAEIRSCTVEMVPLNTDVEVAVIDEIQMIGHEERGWAWTQALLGLKAKELHLCGEERSVPLIRELAASMGDQLEVNTYQRLSPLKTMSTSLHGQLRSLRKGDCVVVFSRVGIHAMKKDIERTTQKRVAIVYGSLPPEVRAQQAKLFNDPDNEYDFLVASDAIGMGLNLAIKRIIFESVHKFNGSYIELIEPAHLKQIAGRAGRYRTSAQAESSVGNLDEGTAKPTPALRIPVPNVGLVTTLERADLPILQNAMSKELNPIMSAGILPPTAILTRFASYYPPSTPFSYILLRLHELSLKHPRYHLCTLRDQIGIADIIETVRNLTIHDRIVLCAAPAAVRDTGMRPIVLAFARCVGDYKSGALLDIPELPLDVLDEEIKVDKDYMSRLEMLHKALILYLWLSYRFAGVFINQAMGFYVKQLVEAKIDKVLAEYSASPAIRARIKSMREQALRKISELNQPLTGSVGSHDETELPEAPFLPENSLAPETGTADLLSGVPQFDEQVHDVEAIAEDNVGASPP